MGGMDCGATTACPGTKRKAAAAAALDNCLPDDGENAAAVVRGAAAAAEFEVEAPRRRPKEIMSQQWIDSVLTGTIKPLPFKERHMRDPDLAAIFHSHERSRTKGYVEVGDGYDKRCELLQAVHKAVFYGREDEEKQAMAKLAALSLRHR
ncbi:unnamed protein product [Urochloa decumbens]|uniref:Uncharacterized protein n=1 Tax=Urochloa decumbens TaxID=240449 RepID=A0ABC9B7A6_9POAL